MKGGIAALRGLVSWAHGPPAAPNRFKMKRFDPGIVLPLESSRFVPCFKGNVIKVNGLIGIKSKLNAPTGAPFRGFLIGLQFSKRIHMARMLDDMIVALEQFDVIGARL